MIARVFNGIKRLLPASLFGRALLILVVPTVLVQVLSAYIFYERHWHTVIRHMSTSLAGEVALLTHEIERAPEESRRRSFIEKSAGLMGVHIYIEEAGGVKHKDVGKAQFPQFHEQLAKRMEHPFTVEETADKEGVLIRVHTKREIINLLVSIKRLASGTTTIFILWMTGSALLLLFIATLFLRNQIRPIRKLAEVAESFGKGNDIQDFRPQGATEVRRAGRAFLVMRERIKRQIRSRIEMLAGISHDLRTPLTRMKLQIAMLNSRAQEGLNADVTQMEHMIEEYLDFARGEGGEDPVDMKLSTLLERVVDNARRQGQEVTLEIREDAQLPLRVQAMTRALTNLVENAIRYGQVCRITLDAGTTHAEVQLEDEGPGIAPQDHSAVFKPFTRLEPSRNINSGGVGLGLTIARDIIQAHGGAISLDYARPGALESKGLRVRIKLPQ